MASALRVNGAISATASMIKWKLRIDTRSARRMRKTASKPELEI